MGGVLLADVAPDGLIEHMQGFVGKALSVPFQRLPRTLRRRRLVKN